MDDFYTARSSTKPPLPWTNFAPPFSAMIFVPSIGGISHNPREASSETDLVAGANVLLEVVRKMVT